MISTQKGAPERAEPRRHSDLRPEFVALGLLAEGPGHGYELFRRFKTSLEGLWRISESQFYSILKRLEARGLVAAEDKDRAADARRGSDGARPSGGPARRLLSLTPAGRALLDEWIHTPTASSSRLIHLEFLTRLYFANSLFPGETPALIEAQASTLADDLRRLEAARAVSEGLGSLSAEFREGQLRAALAWIEASAAPALGRP